MKASFLFPILLVYVLTACTKPEAITPVNAPSESVPVNPTYQKAAALRAILDHYTTQGLPGVAMAVYTPAHGYWAGASGYAQMETKTAMKPNHLQYSQSIVKTYMAVVILKLVEVKQLDLDVPISRYLPTVEQFIRDARSITLRMLLNHQSGIYDYTEAPAYVSHLLQHPLQVLTSYQLLAYVKGKPLSFTPGSQYNYCNTNYLLLSLVADQITGDHARFLRETVIRPAGLNQTFYHDHIDYLRQSAVVNSYFDRFGNGKLENVTRWQQANVASMQGDDGLIASPLDYIQFMQSLIEGRQVPPALLNWMTTWLKGSDANPVYGMGLSYITHKEQPGYGHSGAGIGAASALYYFPGKQVYVFIGVNTGTLTGGPTAHLAEAMQEELLDELLT